MRRRPIQFGLKFLLLMMAMSAIAVGLYYYLVYLPREYAKLRTRAIDLMLMSPDSNDWGVGGSNLFEDGADETANGGDCVALIRAVNFLQNLPRGQVDATFEEIVTEHPGRGPYVSVGIAEAIFPNLRTGKQPEALHFEDDIPFHKNPNLIGSKASIASPELSQFKSARILDAPLQPGDNPFVSAEAAIAKLSKEKSESWRDYDVQIKKFIRRQAYEMTCHLLTPYERSQFLWGRNWDELKKTMVNRGIYWDTKLQDYAFKWPLR